ncbi:MAG: serine/threonine protein kinase [Planctomycetota bacterium]|jgi:serine/threonine-protein kinase
MASKRDIEIASLLYRSGILSQEEIQSALGYQGTLLTEGKVVSLVDILVERELLPEDSAATFTEEPLEKIEPLPDYDLEAQVGDGASARVYRGTYKKRDLACAVKILHPEQELQSKALKRFMREAHLLCKLRHPNIVQGYEVRKVNGFRFLSMEWFNGGTLLEEIDRRGQMDGPTALHITRQIASALGYLYGKGIVHRDIKPGNVLIDNECNAKLIDLGLCRLVAQETDEMEGTTVGTVGYISPEQAKGAGDLDIRSDIYSLGVSLYHMVVGEVPFSGDDDFEVMSKQIMQSLRSDRIKSLNISPHVHYAIEKMMAKDRDIRFQLPDDIVADIDAYLASIDFKPITTAKPAKDEPKAKTKSPSGKSIDIVSTRKRGRSGGRKPRTPSSRRRRRR